MNLEMREGSQLVRLPGTSRSQYYDFFAAQRVVGYASTTATNGTTPRLDGACCAANTAGSVLGEDYFPVTFEHIGINRHHIRMTGLPHDDSPATLPGKTKSHAFGFRENWQKGICIPPGTRAN